MSDLPGASLQWCARCKQWTAPEVAGRTTHYYACPFCGWPTEESGMHPHQCRTCGSYYECERDGCEADPGAECVDCLALPRQPPPNKQDEPEMPEAMDDDWDPIER